MYRNAFVVVLIVTCAVLIDTQELTQQTCIDASTSMKVAVTGHRNPSGHWVSQVVVGDADQKQSKILEVDVEYREKKTCSSEETRSDIVITFTAPLANKGHDEAHVRQAPQPVSVLETKTRRPQPLPAGYLGLRDISYFKVYIQPATWSNARHQCNQDGGHLASINTPEKFKFVQNLNALGKFAWIDLHEEGVHNVYYTATGQKWELPSFLEWSQYHPADDDIGSDCVMLLMGDNRIEDAPCEQQFHPYICEIPWVSL